MLLAWVTLHIFRRDLLNRGIWLISEKRSEARDNGMHFFKFCRENHPEINIYYVIEKNSSDMKNIESLGNILYSDSFSHCLYYLSAEKDISSQARGSYPFGLRRKDVKRLRRLCNKNKKIVFLQHGIIKDELSHDVFDYDKSCIDYFVTSAPREYEFVKQTYGYPEGSIGCVGLCRFDKLYRSKSSNERMILIMPTWRKSLKREVDGVSFTSKEKTKFYESSFYKSYRALLTNDVFLCALKEQGFKVVFYMHFQMQDYSELFEGISSKQIIIANRYDYDVQDLLVRANLLVTDFSSVFFDFAYMGKPVIYYQFDREDFRKTHYSEGYFDYDTDGFGPCLNTGSSVIEEIINRMDDNMSQPQEYQNRVDQFFVTRDDHNCERTFADIFRL